MDSKLLHQKLRAFAVHLAVSALVFLPIVVLIFQAWFPDPWYQVQGVVPMVLLMAGLHLLMAPLLTLIVFKSGKKGMLFDLVVIGALQLAALAYGVAMIHSERPSYVVFSVDRFVTLSKKDVAFPDHPSQETAAARFRGPRYVFAQLPLGDELQQFQFDVLFGGAPDLERRPEYWLRFETGAEAVWKTARPVSELMARQPDLEAALRDWVRGEGYDVATARVLPLVGKKRDFAALIDPSTSRVRDVFPVYPWRD